MPEHTVHTPAEVCEFIDRLREFLSGKRDTLDDAFTDVGLEAPADEDGASATWRVTGAVRGAYRAMPIGAPAPTRHRALAIGLTLDVDDPHRGSTRATLETGRGHLRIDACLLYTSPSPRDRQKSRMPSSA